MLNYPLWHGYTTHMQVVSVSEEESAINSLVVSVSDSASRVVRGSNPSCASCVREHISVKFCGVREVTLIQI